MGKHTRYREISVEEIKKSSTDWKTIVGLSNYEGTSIQAVYEEIKKHPDRFILRTLEGSKVTILARIAPKQIVPGNFSRGKVAPTVPPSFRKYDT
jgi:hypothetical protein